MSEWFVVNEGLVGAGRLPSRARAGQRISALELGLLLASGAAAAVAVAYEDLHLRIPGHAIVIAALPLVFGMSVAPRRLAGSIMTVGAISTALLLPGAGLGSGAFVSLSLLGPMMDVALHGARSGWRLYARLVAAGVATNVLALAARAGAKILGFDFLGARPFDSWWAQAIVTYTLSGVVAGLLGALCWFHFNERSRTSVRPKANA